MQFQWFARPAWSRDRIVALMRRRYPSGPAYPLKLLEAVAFVFPERPVVRWNRADGCRWRELLATWTFVCSAADWSLSTENRHQREFQRQPLTPGRIHRRY